MVGQGEIEPIGSTASSGKWRVEKVPRLDA
jgi:hypothetical protein